MTTPLPITVRGPITPISPAVQVTGALAGAKIQLINRDTGETIGTATARKNGELLVKIDSSLIKVGNGITGIQSVEGKDSSQSAYPVQVIAVKLPLDVPVIRSVLHTCMTDIKAEALVPGARVVTAIGGTLFGTTEVRERLQWLDIDREAEFPAGADLTLYQEADIDGNTVTSESAQGPPITKFELDTDQLPAGNVGPLHACDTNFQCSQMVAGAETTMVHENGSKTVWKNPSDLFVVRLSSMLAKGSATLTQALPRCKPEGKEWSVDIRESGKPPPLTVSHYFCPDVPSMTIQGAVPGATLHIRKLYGPGGNTKEVVGTRGIASAIEFVELPPGTFEAPEGTPGVGGLEIAQEKCGVLSDWVFIGMTQPGGPYNPPAIAADLYECGMAIPIANSGKPGSVVQAFDESGPISDPQTIRGDIPLGYIRTWLRLKVGKIWIVQTGCNAEGKTQGEVKPIPMPVPLPKIKEPVRPGSDTLRLEGVLTGAQVYALVDGEVASDLVEVLDTVGFLKLKKPLEHKQRVVAVQIMCSHRSEPRADDGVTVLRGRLKVTGLPVKAIRDATISFTATAVDADTGEQVVARVELNNQLLGMTGQVLSYSPRMGDSPPAGVIKAPPAYEDAVFTITLEDPVRDFVLTLGAYTAPTSFFPDLNPLVFINRFDYTVTPLYDPGSAKRPPATPNPANRIPAPFYTSVTLPIPTGSEKRVSITVGGEAEVRDWTSIVVPEKISLVGASFVYAYAGHSSGYFNFQVKPNIVWDPVTGANLWEVVLIRLEQDH